MKKDINPVQAQLNLAVVALVALVAIVGLVALVLNAPVLGKEVVPSVEQAAQIENAVGDASAGTSYADCYKKNCAKLEGAVKSRCQVKCQRESMQ